MSESPDAGKPVYGVLRLSSTDGNTSYDLEEVRRTALQAAETSGQTIAVFQIVGYAVPPAGPATWLPSVPPAPWIDAPAEMASIKEHPERFTEHPPLHPPLTYPTDAAAAERRVAEFAGVPLPPSTSTPAEPAAAPPSAATPPPEAPAAPPELSGEEVPWADGENRVKPKYPTVRGVELPKYADITSTAGLSGPALPETVAAAEEECARIGGQLEKTVTAWVGLPLKQVNQATMEKVVEILRNWKR